MGNAFGFVLLVLLLVSAVIVYTIVNSKRNKARLERKIRESWGKVPKPEKKASECSNYFKQYKEEVKDRFLIDDITWNDLDMDEVFARLNSCWSTVGEEYLYSLLREPLFDENALKERGRLIDFFMSNPRERAQLQYLLARLGKVKSVDIPFYIYNKKGETSKRGLYYKLLAAVPVLSLAGMIINFPAGLMFFILSMTLNSTIYYKTKNEIASQLEALSYIVALIFCGEKASFLNIEEIKEYRRILSESVRKVRGIGKKSFYVLYKTEDPLIEYVKVVLLGELIAFESISSIISKYSDDIIRIYKTLGFLESMISIASYRESIKYYSTPQLSRSDGKTGLQLYFKDIYHPLIKEPVPNSLHAEKPVLITGSNASGKSTFLKTVAINAIFAQTIYTCLAAEYSSNYFMIFTSMALKDNLSNNESYFIAEIKSLKRIIDSLNSGIPCLCFIDEVLRGTNTVERIAASSQVLRYLGSSNCLCFAATHDIELTSILEGYFENYHFRESFSDNEITFDYRLYPGRSNTRNAIKLLRFMGYPDSIVQDAENRANSFLAEGSWKRV